MQRMMDTRKVVKIKGVQLNGTQIIPVTRGDSFLSSYAKLFFKDSWESKSFENALVKPLFVIHY